MGAGVFIGEMFPGFTDTMRSLEIGGGINLAIAVLMWFMIFPMMLKVDFASVKDAGKNPAGLLITLAVNWLVKPFSMALFGYLFVKVLFVPFIGEELANQYMAGLIILAAAPCTAMVFVWSSLTKGDPGYTLVQVSVNDLIMLFAFAPIVKFLVSGTSDLSVPYNVLFLSVTVFVAVPLISAVAAKGAVIKTKGKEWFENSFVPFFQPLSISALLATLVFIFAFQSENITSRLFHVLLLSIPILLQVYFNSGLIYWLMRRFRIRHNVASPGALIGASNFFELAVATAISLYGPESGAALATVVGVLVEVPVMLSVCSICVRSAGWYKAAGTG